MIPVFAVKNRDPVPKVAGTKGEGIGSLFGLNCDWIAMKGSKKVSLSPSSPRGPLLFGLAMPRPPAVRKNTDPSDGSVQVLSLIHI